MDKVTWNVGNISNKMPVSFDYGKTWYPIIEDKIILDQPFNDKNSALLYIASITK